MNLKDVQRVLKAKILVGEELMERPVETCCGSDLMSDVLAFTKCNTLCVQALQICRLSVRRALPICAALL